MSDEQPVVHEIGNRTYIVAPVEPLDVDGVRTLAVGTALWGLAFLMLLPFYRAGETLFGKAHVPIFSVHELIHRFEAGPRQFIIDYGMVGLYGVVAWCLVAPPVAALLYLLLRGPLKAMSSR